MCTTPLDMQIKWRCASATHYYHQYYALLVSLCYQDRQVTDDEQFGAPPGTDKGKEL